MSARLIPAWQARLALGFEARDGRSVLARREQFGPMAVQKPLYPEGDAVCLCVLLHPPGGIAGGDQLTINLTLDADAHALITTPGAAKWYRSVGPVAQQQVRCSVAAGAVLEYLPQETILFDGCRGDSALTVELASGARYIGWDISVMGRPASDEAYLTGVFRQHTRLTLAGQLLLQESARLAGGEPGLSSRSGYRGCRVVGTLLAAGVKCSAELLAACRALPLTPGALAGVTLLPELLVVRYLGHDAETARRYFEQLWALLRPELIGRAAVPPRIWTT